jgi:hypothetical protein
MSVLWDVREATIVRLSNGDIQSLARTNHELQRARGSGRAAILVSGDADFGVARMFQAYADTFPWETLISRDLAEAVRWLDDAPRGADRGE